MMPIGQWLRGPLRDWAEDLLDPTRMKETGMLEPKAYSCGLATALVWSIQLAILLVVVLMFEAWRRRWMEGGAPPFPARAA
jgi:asparagine synthase (glutamine-hydrolysing)